MPETGDLTYCETQCPLRGKLPCAYLMLEGLDIVVEAINPDVPVHDYGSGIVATTGERAEPYRDDVRKVAAACAKLVSEGRDPILLDSYESE